jgi:hypothetical protein
MVIHADGSPVSTRMDHPIRSRCTRFYGHFLRRAVRFAGFLHERGTDLHMLAWSVKSVKSLRSWYLVNFANYDATYGSLRRWDRAGPSRRFDGRLSARSRNGVHISDHRLAALIHMHMLDADGLRATVPQAT